MAESAIKYTCGMAQRQLSDYYYELDTKIKAQYLEKISLIKQKDPYLLYSSGLEYIYIQVGLSLYNIFNFSQFLRSKPLLLFIHDSP